MSLRLGDTAPDFHAESSAGQALKRRICASPPQPK